jgi:mRNA interferase MazF
MRFGEVWWVEFDERRPVVLVAEPEADAVRAIQVVEPARVDIAGVAVELEVGPAEGLPFTGVLRVALPMPGLIPCTWEITLRPEDLLERAGELSGDKLLGLQELLRLTGQP